MNNKYLKYDNYNQLPLHYKPAHEIRRMLDSKEISPLELRMHINERIEKNKKLNAFISIINNITDKHDKNIQNNNNVDNVNDSEIFKNSSSSTGYSLSNYNYYDNIWTNIPVSLKDNIVVKGVKTTAGSKILNNYIPFYDASVVKKLKSAGAVIVGKTNMDEFAMGSSTENSAFGPTLNPWNTSCVPGGSSGGSAVAVAAGLSYMALGSDTGGSIRQPAALCGVCGMKPTYGRVSRYGLIAFASSLDQIGPFTRDAVDMACALDVICGYDHRDSTSNKTGDTGFYKFLQDGYDIKNLKIGIVDEHFSTGIETGVTAAVEETIEWFKKAGASIVQVKLPHTNYAVPVYYLIATAEASSNLARFDGVKYGFRASEFENLKDMYMQTRKIGFGAEVKRRIILGTYALSSGYYDAYYKTAQKARTKIKEDYNTAFQQADIILSPVTPSTAFKFGEKINDPLAMYLSDIFTISANLASIPAISIPCGFSGGMPVGLQLSANHFQEKLLLAVAHEFQKNTTHHLCFADIE